MDYLAEEVLKLQPDGVRSFLLQTSILDRMCAPLCDAVVKADTLGPAAGQAMLEALERMGLFVISLDDERRWYRYHHLFADVLNRRLAHEFPHQLLALHGRASQWYEQNGFISEALHHAVMAGEPDRAAQLVEENGCPLIMRGESITLLKWIDGEPMAKLLYQAKSRRMGPSYVAELLSAMGTAPGAELPFAQLLIEPLTTRELEVLQQIEAGYSNQAIAEKLVISLTTVKRHISNIYAKLSVKSRTQATSHARELGLVN